MKRFAIVCLGAALCFGSAVYADDHGAKAKADAQGEKVFLNYTQAELDKNYNQGEWAPNIRQILQRYGARSETARERLGNPEKLSYGDSEVETFDLFRAENEKAPLHVFIHGGAWRAGKAAGYHFPAQMFLDNGISYAALDFGYVQDIGLDGMAEQLRNAIAWMYKNADKLGIDKDRIYISGHSSGGHLGGVLLVTDWSKYDVPADVIKGATLISGMYDLKPVRLSARSSYVPFTDELEDAMSTQRHLDKINTPVILAYGGLETDEFKRQTQDFAKAMKEAGKPVELIFAEHYNHFEIMDDFGNPYGLVSAAALTQAGAESK
ncbi:alpha/beta hydrolase [Pusillimonas sp. DMV24BSW_D]|uniref:alpha/beta hydrolase n=1 Tax=Neopusillimonas aestuarii TaxID=2716226 RepID=UPI001408EA7B|nr:alpha/beta hydrolase [Pusillimonas sp. DMV24BSW_D]QIM47841.1 alpha/beta hydrolase [Pusillimonas sp. DMV24BSW_D]